MPDILSEIVEKRTEDYLKYGPSFSSTLPRRRERPSVPFLAKRGLILEIKRASPSKGPIHLDMDPVAQALTYRAAGAIAISVLTESRYFKGSLDDLREIGSVIWDVALLRKDFLFYPEEVEISYRAGADAVLLIARILPKMRLRVMAARCRSLGMTAFVEVRDEADLAKLKTVLGEGTAVAGVNSRDLKTFTIDPLVPALFRKKLGCSAVYESGADSLGSCIYAGSLGYEGMLIGESVVRNPEKAEGFVKAFSKTHGDSQGNFWKSVAEKRAVKKGQPLVKICGITQEQDALKAAELGADMLGFVFAESQRQANKQTVFHLSASLRGAHRPLFVGVITELESPLAGLAVELARNGELDVIQCHGDRGPEMMEKLRLDGIPCYAAYGIEDESDIDAVEKLKRNGEPRVLCDAKMNGQSGGMGVRISEDLMSKLRGDSGLWLAGGIGPEFVRKIVQEYAPELIDVSSGIETAAGIKDHTLMEKLFGGLA
jgi:indole-3-glycerol phosphate synthase/phosphoribosylanthranilate isomerase